MPKKIFYSIQAVFALLSIIIAGFFINPHMDEYLPFSFLSYLKPAFKYNVFNDGYDYYLIYIFNHIKYRMSYFYIGNTSSILYYPFYKLLPYRISAAIYSIVALILFCLLFKKAGRFSNGSMLLLLCFFPLVIQVLHDGGPIKVALLVYPLTAILFKNLIQAEAIIKKYGYALLLGLLWFIPLEDKLFFVYLFPCVLLFAIALLPDQYFNIRLLKQHLKYLLLALIVFFALSAVFLLSTVQDASGHTSVYITSMLHENHVAAPDAITALKNRVYILMAFFRYLDFSYYAGRNVTLGYNGIRFWVCIMVYALILWTIIRNKFSVNKTQKNSIIPLLLQYRLKLLSLSFLSLVFTFTVFGKTNLGHHYVFMWVPILAMVCSIQTALPTIYNNINKILLVYSIFSLALIATSKPLINNSSDLQKEIYSKLDSLNYKGNYIINYSSWNGYFIRELDPRKNEIVTYLNRENHNIKSDATEFTAFAVKSKLAVLNVSEYPDTQDSLRKLFPEVKRIQHVNTQTHLHSIDILYFQ